MSWTGKLPGLIQDLMESDNDGEMEIPVEVVASFSDRERGDHEIWYSPKPHRR